jgi:hypothetical protein
MDFVTRVIPTLPAWIPAHSFLACVFGAILIAAGVAILIEKVALSAALLLGIVILSPFALLPALLVTTPLLPFRRRLWTMAGKHPALSGKFQFGAAFPQAVAC